MQPKPPADIRNVIPEGLRYTLALGKKFTDELGFLPRPAIEKYCQTGGVFEARQNGDPCGFIIVGFVVPLNPATVRIYQAAVQMDAQRRHHGLALVDHVCKIAGSQGIVTATCWCLEGLAANLFWRDAGFVEFGLVDGGSRRGRKLIGWAKPLNGRFITPDDAVTFAALARRKRQLRVKETDMRQRPLFS